MGAARSKSNDFRDATYKDYRRIAPIHCAMQLIA
jgi:hypothetical protein